MNRPLTMRALRLHQFDGLKSLKVEEVAAPKIAHDEILIKVAASPINPSDQRVRSTGRSCRRSQPRGLFFKDQRVEGFWLGTALAKKSYLSKISFVWRAKGNATGDLSSKINRTVPLTELPSIAASGLGPASEGKIILKP